MWVYEKANQDRKWLAPVTSTTTLHRINKVTLENAEWENNSGGDDYVSQSFVFSGAGGYQLKLLTFDTNGIVIKDADNYIVKYVTDDDGVKSIVIELMPKGDSE